MKTNKLKKNQEWIKRNFIQLAREHRKVCKISNCTISLFSLEYTMEKLRIPLTLEEKEEFL